LKVWVIYFFAERVKKGPKWIMGPKGAKAPKGLHGPDLAPWALYGPWALTSKGSFRVEHFLFCWTCLALFSLCILRTHPFRIYPSLQDLPSIFFFHHEGPYTDENLLTPAFLKSARPPPLFLPQKLVLGPLDLFVHFVYVKRVDFYKNRILVR